MKRLCTFPFWISFVAGCAALGRVHRSHLLFLFQVCFFLPVFAKAACPSLPEVGSDLMLRLPFPTGDQYGVSQAYCDGDHAGYQVDFLMPSNRVVVAAAGGTVIEVGTNSANCPTGCGGSVLDGGIYVKIRHQGRTAMWYSSYLHLNRRIVNSNDTVQAGQIIGYSGNTGWASGAYGGFHLHFHVRSAPAGDVNGVRPTPMQGREVETGAQPITNFVAGNTYLATDGSNGPPQLLVSRATQVEWQSQDSYSYQLFRTNALSTNIADWQPVGDRVVGDGNWLTLTAKTDGTTNSLMAAVCYPPDLTRRIVGLRDVDLDTALTTTEGRTLTIAGMRVQSRDYGLQDYLTDTSDMDFAKHAFLLNSIDVATNVGPTTRGTPWFFLNDSTNGITITNGATVMRENTTYNLNSTGQVFRVNMHAAQTLETATQSASEYQIPAYDFYGKQVFSWITGGNSSWTSYATLIAALRAGTYTIKFLPLSSGTITLSLRFINGNRRLARTFTNGQTISSSLGDYAGDYDKFSIALMGGQTLRLPAPGANCRLDVCNSRGVGVGGMGGIGNLVFQATETDTYYLVYSHSDLSGHSYSGVVNITP
jgi:hypothetical protein